MSDEHRIDPDDIYHDNAPQDLAKLDANGAGVVSFREGARITLDAATKTEQSLFVITLAASIGLQGQPVRCSGYLPSASIRIETAAVDPRYIAVGERFLVDAYKSLGSAVRQWYEASGRPPAAEIEAAGIKVSVARDGRTLRPGVMQIDVRRESDAGAVLVTQPQTTSATSALIDEAVKATLWADSKRFERLPVPVRFRASGAIAAWDRARGATPDGDRFTQALRDPDISPAQLLNHIADFMESQSRREFVGDNARAIAQHVSNSVVWQAFWARSGALYEPTPPLHRLLDSAYIADDVPLSMLKVPLRTLCIVPEPSRWDHKGGLESAAVFSHTSDGARVTHLTIVSWTHWSEPEPMVGMDMMRIDLREPERTLAQVIDDALARPPMFGESRLPIDQDRDRWRTTLDYIVKMLLYLTLDDAIVTPERSYTNASRTFPGLGKRKKLERLAELELLYDRHLVGPALLPDTANDRRGDGQHHEVTGHWRRPYFRMQPHGPRNTLRKLKLIDWSIVRPDRLGL